MVTKHRNNCTYLPFIKRFCLVASVSSEYTFVTETSCFTFLSHVISLYIWRSCRFCVFHVSPPPGALWTKNIEAWGLNADKMGVVVSCSVVIGYQVWRLIIGLKIVITYCVDFVETNFYSSDWIGVVVEVCIRFQFVDSRLKHIWYIILCEGVISIG
jgi:hypothetical protein